MAKYHWEQEERQTYKSLKKRLDKDRFCKKNRIGKNKYGPHDYSVDEKHCSKCGHRNKDI